MTLTELKEKAKDLGIKNYGQKKEETLINEIEKMKELTIDEQLLKLSQSKTEYTKLIKDIEEQEKVLLSNKKVNTKPMHELLKEQKEVNERLRKEKIIANLKVIDFINK